LDAAHSWVTVSFTELVYAAQKCCAQMIVHFE
jgi:hypothetical protein